MTTRDEQWLGRDGTAEPRRASQERARQALSAIGNRRATLERQTDGARREGEAADEESALILDEDPDLAAYLSPQDRRDATSMLRARVIRVDSSPWQPPSLEPGAFGLLILDGLIGRHVRIGNGVNIELLGSGDILRPSESLTQSDPIPVEVSWRVFMAGRVAILDERLTTLIGRRAQLLVAFSDRLLRRARHAQYLAAISHMRRVDERLLLTLWHLASNWGRVTPQGICVSFRLSHSVLGELVGATRPSVTTAMMELQRRGDVIRREDGRYVLTGAPDDLDAKSRLLLGGLSADGSRDGQE